MKNLDIRKYNPSILRNATLITDGNGYMRTYNLNNGLIFKQVKESDTSSLSQLLYHDDFVDCLTKKLELAKYIEDSDIVLPKTVYCDKTEVVGYTVPFINMDNFDNILRNSKSQEFIIESFLLLCNAVKKANKEGIVFPDLGNASNIFYNPKTKEIRFIDYDGLQIGECDSFNISTLMSSYDNPTFETEKYFDKNTTLFTSNFDKATLLALFLYYTTKTNLTRFNLSEFVYSNGSYKLKKEALDSYLEDIGLIDADIKDDIELLYDEKNNKYLETSIKKLNKSHTLDFSSYTFKKR